MLFTVNERVSSYYTHKTFCPSRLSRAMLVFLQQRRYHHNLGSTDGLTLLALIEIVAILVHYQPSYNTPHTMKPSDRLLLKDVALYCEMYPVGKVDISQHVAIPRFPQVVLKKELCK